MISIKYKNSDSENIKDELICISIFSSFIVLSVQYFLLINFSLLGTGLEKNIQMLSKIIIFIFFMLSLPTVINRSMKVILITFITIMIIILLNRLFFPNDMYFFNYYLFNFLFICIPSFLYTYSLRNLLIFKKIMIISAYIIFITSGSICFSAIFFKLKIGFYDMTLSYYLLFPLIVFFNEYCNNKKINNFILSFFSFIFIIIFGSRGPILCFIFFIFFKLIFNNKKTKIIYKINLIVFLIIVVIFYKKIFFVFYKLILYFGLDSRNLNLFLREDIYMTGRDVIYNQLIEGIKSNPLIGYGLAGDMYLLNGYGFAHNFFLEIIINFGIFIGSLIIIYIIYILYRVMTSKKYLNVELSIILCSLGFIHLFVSSSYLFDFKFWVFLGFIFNIVNNKSNCDFKNINNM